MYCSYRQKGKSLVCASPTFDWNRRRHHKRNRPDVTHAVHSAIPMGYRHIGAPRRALGGEIGINRPAAALHHTLWWQPVWAGEGVPCRIPRACQIGGDWSTSYLWSIHHVAAVASLDRLLCQTSTATAAITMMPPAKLAMNGTSLKQPHTHVTASGRFQRVDQRVLSGGDHLPADGEKHQTQVELCRVEEEQLQLCRHRAVVANGQTKSGHSSTERHAADNIGGGAQPLSLARVSRANRKARASRLSRR